MRIRKITRQQLRVLALMSQPDRQRPVPLVVGRQGLPSAPPNADSPIRLTRRTLDQMLQRGLLLEVEAGYWDISPVGRQYLGPRPKRWPKLGRHQAKIMQAGEVLVTHSSEHGVQYTSLSGDEFRPDSVRSLISRGLLAPGQPGLASGGAPQTYVAARPGGQDADAKA